MIRELFESAVIAGGLELSELVACGDADRITVAVGTAVECDHHGVDPLEVVEVAERRLQRVAEGTHATDEAVGVAHLAERRVAAELVLDGRESVDEASDAGHELGDLLAECAEAVGQLVGARGQPVEVIVAVAYLYGCVVQPLTDFAGLMRRAGRFQRYSGGPGDPPDRSRYWAVGLFAAPSAPCRLALAVCASRVVIG